MECIHKEVHCWTFELGHNMVVLAPYPMPTLVTSHLINCVSCNPFAIAVMGDAKRFAMLGHTTVTNTGNTYAMGDVGVYSGEGKGC